MPRDASSLASWFYRGIAGPFNLKTAFHAFELHAKVAFPFFLSFRDSLLPVRALRSVYVRAVPPFVFIRAIGKGVRSRAFYLSSCFTA